MFFLLRCAFWLTIVFHAMSWPDGAAQDAGAQLGVLKMATDAAGTLATAAGSAVTAKVEESCSKAPAECLALAARLPQIVAMNEANEPLPPKRPLRLDGEKPVSTISHPVLAQSEAGHSAVAAHKPVPQHKEMP